jgi:hypothetical protein
VRDLYNHVVESVTASVGPSRLKLPDVSPENIVGMIILRDHEVDGSICRAEILKRLEKVGDGTTQFIIDLGGNNHQK